MEEMIAMLHEMMKRAAERGWIRAGDLKDLLEDLNLQPELIRAVFRYLENQKIRALPNADAAAMDPGENQTLAIDRLNDEEQKLLQMIYGMDGCRYTLEDIAKYLHVGTDFARKIVLDIGKTIDDVRYLPRRRDLLPAPDSIPDFQAEKAEDSQERQSILEQRRDLLIRILPELTPREAEIIRMRMGMDERSYTTEEVAERFGVTTQRIRQVANKALRKALRFEREKNIRDFYI